MLELVNVTKTFSEQGDFCVLKDINIQVQPGKFVCILGPSGCGKTILLYLIAGFIKPTTGKISLNKQEIKGPDLSRMMIFQNYVMFPWKTVFNNVLFSLSTVQKTTKEKNDLVMESLKLVGLEDFKDWYPHHLSGGMQQRVAVARALVVNPSFVLMDEPFAALDSQYRKYLRQNLEEIWLKIKNTVLFVTHSIYEAICLADTIYLLSARPATIKKVYEIDLPRPRDTASKQFLDLEKEIEAELAIEFEKIKNLTDDHSVDNLVKIN